MIKKTLLTTLLILGCLWGAGELKAATEIDGIYYNLYATYSDNPYAEVTYNTSYNTYSGNITIPSSVESGGKTYTVTKIGPSAFRDCTGLTSVSIPEGITSIGDYAFYGCNNASFRSITLPSTVTSIASTKTGRAFYNCTYLESINIPSGVTNIPQYSFYGCSALSSVNIPSGVTTITSYSFSRCSSLTSIILPASITTIESIAFYLCTNLASVTVLGETPPTLNNAAVFQRSYTSGDYPTNFYVLKGSGDTYKEATYWSTYSSRISELSSINFVNLDLTNSVTALTIPSEVVLTVTGTLTNPDASKLVIADGGQLVCNNTVSATVHKTIAGHDGSADKGWHFIASPVADDIDPVDVDELINATAANYDLYRFNQNPDQVINGNPYAWENYKAHTDGFNLTNGQGYLYANANGADLIFTGEINPGTSNTYSVLLAYSGEASTKGWNLVGNPFTCNATLDYPCYTISDDGRWANASGSGTTIAPGTGVMVRTTEGGQSVTFTKAPNTTPDASSNSNSIQLVLSQTINHRGTNTTETLDNAIVSFNQGSELSKFYFGTQNANIYIPQNGREFAIVTAGNQGQVPVNFRAHANGQYTLNFKSPLTSNLSSLTLIDNLTGAHVDLLQTPSYTFQGNTTDISARFRLLFTTTGVDENDDENQTDFAFISDGQLIVNGNGTLYVYDALGRQISAKQVTPLTSNLLPLTTGVYVLQLVNGNSMRTQKIIVK